MSKDFDKIEQMLVRSYGDNFENRIVFIGKESRVRKKIIKSVFAKLEDRLKDKNGKIKLRSSWAKSIANKIYQDLGGDSFAKIIGLRNKSVGLMANEYRPAAPALYFFVKSNPMFIETVGISITNKNLYDLSFSRKEKNRFGNAMPVTLSFVNDVSRDMLQETIKKHTGLYTSL